MSREMELTAEEWSQVKAIIKAARDVINNCDFTSFGGEAQDAFMELEQAMQDWDDLDPRTTEFGVAPAIE